MGEYKDRVAAYRKAHPFTCSAMNQDGTCKDKDSDGDECSFCCEHRRCDKPNDCSGCEEPCRYWLYHSAERIVDQRMAEEGHAKRFDYLEKIPFEKRSFEEHTEFYQLRDKCGETEAVRTALTAVLYFKNCGEGVDPENTYKDLQKFISELAGRTCYPNPINNKEVVELAMQLAFNLGWRCKENEVATLIPSEPPV